MKDNNFFIIRIMPPDMYVYNVSQQLLTHIQVQPNVVLILQLTLYVFKNKTLSLIIKGIRHSCNCLCDNW